MPESCTFTNLLVFHRNVCTRTTRRNCNMCLSVPRVKREKQQSRAKKRNKKKAHNVQIKAEDTVIALARHLLFCCVFFPLHFQYSRVHIENKTTTTHIIRRAIVSWTLGSHAYTLSACTDVPHDQWVGICVSVLRLCVCMRAYLWMERARDFTWCNCVGYGIHVLGFDVHAVAVAAAAAAFAAIWWCLSTFWWM